MEPMRRKRKEPAVCPNPLFMEWITQWRDDAANKGLKSHQSYNKALVSLKKYPLPLSDGAEAKMLNGFGDKICKMLDKQLKEHIEEFGVGSVATTLCHGTTSPVTTNCQSVCRAVTSNNETLQSSPKVSGAAEMGTKRKSLGRKYIPAHRSGAYAILLTLHQHYISETCSKHWLSKAELQEQAQSLSDKSFTKPENPECRYTAWSSMSTLLSKELVTKCSNPAKYELTPAGCTLAESILASEASGKIQDTTSVNSSAAPAATTAAGRGTLQYWYVSSEGKRVFSRSRAATAATGWPLLLCKRDRLGESGLPYTLPPHLHTTAGFPQLSAGAVYAYVDIGEAMCRPPANSTILTAEQQEPRKPVQARQVTLDEVLPQLAAAAPSTSSKATNLPPASSSQSSSHSSSSSLTNHSQTSNTAATTFQRFTLQPNTFDVVLYVDVQETNGGVQNNRKDEIVQELRRNGVHYEIRKLYVGDFLWVARERSQRQPGVLSSQKSQELVLDYIIERKRMDDLAGSITDGRFREQKFRLRQCGISIAIYLVEEFGSIHNYQIPAQTLMQATVNTQVVDDFYVKSTKDLKDSAAYLTVMTRYLQNLYSNKILISCTREDKPKNDLNFKEHNLMVFNNFNQASIKTKVPSVYELFCKQLLQFARMTTEKVLAVTELYKTPQELLQAYTSCNSEREKELLVSKVKYGKMKTNLGPALSKSLYHVYCSGQNPLR